jgi:16S rRNA (guanine966-N2)-methyltransferase
VNSSSRSSSVRIIGGAWRGRKISIPPCSQVRPTPDRIRETVFNWLASCIRGARVLDLFAGTGVLGVEALSRGAGCVHFVERDPEVTTALQRVFESFSIGASAQITTQEAQYFLGSHADRYDLVFLDPPYNNKVLLLACLYLLKQQSCLAPGALVYIETDIALEGDALPRGYEWKKQKKAGQVYYGLLEMNTAC